MTHIKKYWYWYLIALVIIVLIWKWSYFKGLFTGATSSARMVYDAERCCKAGNPCSWSSSTYNRVCSGS